jgi:hypothetical protein
MKHEDMLWKHEHEATWKHEHEGNINIMKHDMEIKHET